MSADTQQLHLLVGDLLSLLVGFGVELGSDGKACAGPGGGDIVEDGVIGLERHPLPVPADLAEQAVFDRVPFRGSGRVVTDGDAQSVTITELLLQIAQPDPGARAIGTTGIGQDKKLGRTGIVFAAAAAPPVLDGIDGECGRFAGGSHDHRTGVAAHVVDAIGESYAQGIRGEVMVVHFFGLAPQGPAAVFEAADQLPFLAIAADDGQVGRLELAALGIDVHELPIASGPVPALVPETGFDVLAVRPEREPHLPQQPPDGIGADFDADGA